MESGLDKSPMYDGEIFDVHTHTMNMSDVGVSSSVCQEAFMLANAIGREPSVGQKFRERGDFSGSLFICRIVSHHLSTW
jgi:hypothetical protein